MAPKRPKIGAIRTPTLFPMEKLDQGNKPASSLGVERPYSEPGIYLGTSSFTASGWEGNFYPAGMKPREFLSYYATQFSTVEVDSTFYGTPSASTVTGWYEKTPADFPFAVKIPQIITHEKVLLDCEAETDEFVTRMELLREKLGPMLLQFPHFDQYAFNSIAEFLPRLRFFLKRVQGMSSCRFAVEIRNKSWLDARFADVLREYNTALVLNDTSFVPRPWERKEQFDLVTADFSYVRWLGDRKGIEKQTKTWDKPIIDRQDDLRRWVELLRRLVSDKRIRRILAFAKQPLRRAWAVDCEVILGFVDQEQVENRNWKLEREKKKIRPSTASNDTAPTR